MRISTALGSVQLLCIDTAPFIYFVETNPIYIERMHYVIQQVGAGNIEVRTSVVTLTEVLHKPLKSNDSNLGVKYWNLLLNSRNIHTESVTVEIASLAASLRVRYNLKTPDALQVATALETRCDAFLTNDRGIQRVTELTVLVVDDLELDPTPAPE